MYITALAASTNYQLIARRGSRRDQRKVTASKVTIRQTLGTFD